MYEAPRRLERHIKELIKDGLVKEGDMFEKVYPDGSYVGIPITKEMLNK